MKTLAGLMVLSGVLLFSSIIFAQSTHTIDFEPGGTGADWAWTVSENDDNPPLEIIANPVSGGINTSANVAKFTARTTGNPWALCFTSSDGEFTFDAQNATVKIMVYKPRISDVGIKFEGPGDSYELYIANTVINQWEELSYDFSSQTGITYNKIVILPDNAADRTDETIYFDNIQVPDGEMAELPPGPTVAAPLPTVPSDRVISLFSDVYSNHPIDTWSPTWDQAELQDTTVAGDNVKLYTNLVFAGIEFTSQTIDATAMTHFHMDIWTPDATALPNVIKIKLVDFGADGAWTGGDDVEHELTFDANSGLASETWVGFDIPLSDFTGLTTRGHLAQLVITSDPNVVWVDNIYFYDSSTGITENIGSVPSNFTLEQNYPNPFNPKTTINFILPSRQHATLKVYDLLGGEIEILFNEVGEQGKNTVTFDAKDLPGGVYFYSLRTSEFKEIKKFILLK